MQKPKIESKAALRRRLMKEMADQLARAPKAARSWTRKVRVSLR